MSFMISASKQPAYTGKSSSKINDLNVPLPSQSATTSLCEITVSFQRPVEIWELLTPLNDLESSASQKLAQREPFPKTNLERSCGNNTYANKLSRTISIPSSIHETPSVTSNTISANMQNASLILRVLLPGRVDVEKKRCSLPVPLLHTYTSIIHKIHSGLNQWTKYYTSVVTTTSQYIPLSLLSGRNICTSKFISYQRLNITKYIKHAYDVNQSKQKYFCQAEKVKTSSLLHLNVRNNGRKHKHYYP